MSILTIIRPLDTLGSKGLVVVDLVSDTKLSMDIANDKRIDGTLIENNNTILLRKQGIQENGIYRYNNGHITKLKYEICVRKGVQWADKVLIHHENSTEPYNLSVLPKPKNAADVNLTLTKDGNLNWTDRLYASKINQINVGDSTLQMDQSYTKNLKLPDATQSVLFSDGKKIQGISGNIGDVLQINLNGQPAFRPISTLKQTVDFIRGRDGSKELPTFSFVNNSTSGMYSATEQLSFSSNDIEAKTFRSNSTYLDNLRVHGDLYVNSGINGITKRHIGLWNVLNVEQEPVIATGIETQWWRGDKIWASVTRVDTQTANLNMGLCNIDNISQIEASTYSFSSNTITKLYLSGDNQISIDVLGEESLRIDAHGVTIPSKSVFLININ